MQQSAERQQLLEELHDNSSAKKMEIDHEPHPINYHIIQAVTQRGASKLIDSQGYSYVAKSKNERRTSWRYSSTWISFITPVTD